MQLEFGGLLFTKQMGGWGSNQKDTTQMYVSLCVGW